MTTSEVPEFCPEHGEPEKGVLWKWPCPDYCEYFIDELGRRIEDVAIGGNYFRVTVRRGVMLSQEFRNNRPVGRLRPTLPRLEARKEEIRRMHRLYRAKRR